MNLAKAMFSVFLIISFENCLDFRIKNVIFQKFLLIYKFPLRVLKIQNILHF